MPNVGIKVAAFHIYIYIYLNQMSKSVFELPLTFLTKKNLVQHGTGEADVDVV